jgi:hypothetical protein
LSDRERIISEKTTIQFRKDTLQAIASLDKGACSEFINACLEYDSTGVIKTDFKHEAAGALFALAKSQLDDAMEQYIKGRQQKIDAIRKRYQKE